MESRSRRIRSVIQRLERVEQFEREVDKLREYSELIKTRQQEGRLLTKSERAEMDQTFEGILELLKGFGSRGHRP